MKDLNNLYALAPVSTHTSRNDLSAVKAITVPDRATGMIIQALTQNVRVTIDGTAATTTLGFQIKAGDPAVLLPVYAGQVIRAIEETATAVLQYQFVRTV